MEQESKSLGDIGTLWPLGVSFVFPGKGLLATTDLAYGALVDQQDEPFWPGPIPRPCSVGATRADTSGLRVPFAACGDGVVRHVEQIASSRQGPFTCIGCEERLTFKRPVKKRQHFAHKADSRCSRESALHQYAKLLLAAARRITLPTLALREGGIEEIVYRGGEVALDSVRLESPERDFQPDAMAIVDGQRRAIEFKVSHAVDEAKQEKVVRAACPMVEIDLSGLKWRKLDGEELDRQILHDAPRHWVHHPESAEAQIRLDTRVVAERKKRGGRLRWHILERPQEPKIDYAWVEEVKADLESAKLDGFVGRSSEFGHWFTVPPILWQSALLHEHLYKTCILSTPGGILKLSGKWSADRRLSSVIPNWMMRDDLSNYKREQLEAAGLTYESYATAEWAVIEYFWRLTSDEQLFIFHKEDQSFQVAPDVHSRIFNRHELEWWVRRILETASDPDPDANARKWMRRHLIEGRNPWGIAGEGGDDFKLLRKRVEALLAMTRTYAEAPIADDLCGLPIQTWREELISQREERDRKAREKLEDAKASRRKRLVEAATRALQNEAAPWLETALIDGVPLLDWASESDDRYWRGCARIDRAEGARKQRVLAAEAAEDLRKRLTSAANKAFRDPARAQLFLNSAHPKLAGRRPIEACETDNDLRVALTLLPKT